MREYPPHAAFRHGFPELRAASGPSGRQAHCIWLRVKIWMASAPMAWPWPGALKTPPVMGTWAPRNITSAA
mgnify:CR=1 FL=1